MGLMLDTCVFIHSEKTHTAINFEKWASYGEAYISAITVTELLIGVHRANTQARKIKRSIFVEAVINEIQIIGFSTKSARVHAEIYAHLAQQGQLIGAHDLIIAATALTHGHALLTMNQLEFNRIPGLEVLAM